MTTDEVLSEDMDTTIRISTETRDELVDLGKKNESYDTILKRLIRFWQENPVAVKLWQEDRGIEDLTVMRPMSYEPIHKPIAYAQMRKTIRKEPKLEEPKRKEKKS